MILLHVQGLKTLLYIGMEKNGQIWLTSTQIPCPKDFAYSTERLLQEWNPVVRH